MGSQVKRLPRSWQQYSELVQKNPASNNQWTNKLFFKNKTLGYSNFNIGVIRENNQMKIPILKTIKLNFYVKVKKEFIRQLYFSEKWQIASSRILV